MLERPDPHSTDLARQLRRYLAETLHVRVELEPCTPGQGTPLFLKRRYDFYCAPIAGRSCIFMVAAADAEPTPSEIAKHTKAVGAEPDDIVVFVIQRMSAAMRGRLIAHGIAFVVPNNQLYIPQVAMDLREHFRAPVRAHRAQLTPAAQMVLFHHLVGRHEEATPTALAQVLPYTSMTLGRAFDELASHNLATVEREGREKTIRYPMAPRMLLEFSKTLLRSPKRGEHAVKFHDARPPILRAGETALADLTNLAPPATPVYAVLGTGWKEYFDAHSIESLPLIEGADAMIETWYYDPSSLAEHGRVDLPSLFARFCNDPDERVVQAAAELLEKLP